MNTSSGYGWLFPPNRTVSTPGRNLVKRVYSHVVSSMLRVSSSANPSSPFIDFHLPFFSGTNGFQYVTVDFGTPTSSYRECLSIHYSITITVQTAFRSFVIKVNIFLIHLYMLASSFLYRTYSSGTSPSWLFPISLEDGSTHWALKIVKSQQSTIVPQVFLQWCLVRSRNWNHK